MATPTQEELDNLSQACQKLWSLDSNRLTPGQDYDVNVQSGKSVGGRQDVAGQPLFTRVDESVWERPTYQSFVSLLDNYVSSTGQSDRLSPEENREVQVFLNTTLETAPMQYAFNYLVAKGKVREDPDAFKKKLQDIWFEAYNRDGSADSSGFEHVFAGEFDISKGEVSGLHNWIRFYQEEQAGNIDYRGYIFPRRRGSSDVDEQDQMLTVQFAWKGELKKLSSMFVGTSPEFEFALYSLCFLLGEQVNNVEIDRYDVTIKCFSIRTSDGPRVGTTFPELQQEDDTNVRAAEILEEEPSYGAQGGYNQQGYGRQQDEDEGERRRPGQGYGQGYNNNAWGRPGRDDGDDDNQSGGNAWGRPRRDDGDDDNQGGGNAWGRPRRDDGDEDIQGGGNAWGRPRRNDGDDDNQGGGNAWGRPRRDDGDEDNQGGGNAWGRPRRDDYN